MTELFKYKNKEQALSEIDRRLMEAMRPQKQAGADLLGKLRAMAGRRKAGAETPAPAV